MQADPQGIIPDRDDGPGCARAPFTIVDATLINAPSSIKNKDGKRDPEMHQTRKGNQYYFGMKAHIGADDESGLVHSVVGTAANVATLPRLTHCCTASKTRMICLFRQERG